jgi:hypothetical protein
MRKYNKKELSFIENHDLHLLIDYSQFSKKVQQEMLRKVVYYAQELIDHSNQINTEEMFKIAESVQQELRDEFEVLLDHYEEGSLTENQSIQYDQLSKLIGQLEILTNLHPNRILTWDDVEAGYI